MIHTRTAVIALMALALALAAFIGFLAIRVTDEPYCDRQPEPTELAMREFIDRCLAP